MSPLCIIGQGWGGVLSVRDMCLKYRRGIENRSSRVIILWSCLTFLEGRVVLRIVSGICLIL